MRRAILAAFSIGMLATGCRKGNRLPPASDWSSSSESASSTSDVPRLPPGMAPGRRPGDPHAGLDMSGDPHAGLGMSGDPHAGLDMSGDPHAGLDMSGDPHAGLDVTRLGLEAPDPDRKIDPSRRVAGAITVDPEARDRAKPGTSVFVVVKRAGPDGAPSGPALAVDKLTWSGDGVSFTLTDANAMIAGTELGGDVVVMARYDQDSDALTREPGDITGQTRVKIPADDVKLRLDTVLP
jgi:hypothetical protein